MPFLNWFILGSGQLVYGGTTYKNELIKVRYALNIIQRAHSLKRNKIIVCDDKSVDMNEKRIKGLITNKDFDDPHLIALVNVANCKVICTNDSRFHAYISIKQLYNKGVNIPSLYYNHTKHKQLLSKKMTGKGVVLSKKAQQVLMGLIKSKKRK